MAPAFMQPTAVSSLTEPVTMRKGVVGARSRASDSAAMPSNAGGYSPRGSGRGGRRRARARSRPGYPRTGRRTGCAPAEARTRRAPHPWGRPRESGSGAEPRPWATLPRSLPVRPSGHGRIHTAHCTEGATRCSFRGDYGCDGAHSSASPGTIGSVNPTAFSALLPESPCRTPRRPATVELRSARPPPAPRPQPRPSTSNSCSPCLPPSARVISRCACPCRRRAWRARSPTR